MCKWKPLKPLDDIKLFSFQKTTIAYKYYNKKNGNKTILFLYGFGANILMADQFAPHLAELGFTVLTIDYPGHGYSPKNYNISMEMISELLIKLLKSLGEEKIILAGYSFGGIVSLDFYSKYKDKIEKYILIHTTYFFKNSFYKKIIFNLFEKMLKSHFYFTINYIAIPVLRDFFFTGKQIKDARFTAMKNDKQSVIKMFDVTINKDMNSVLKCIDCPVLVIGSNIDLLISRNTSVKISRIIKNCKLKIFAFYGHYSIMSRPKITANIINDFINE